MSLDLERYMSSQYVNGGRVWPHWDCWGMVRQAYIDLHGIELPMLDGLNAGSTAGKSRHYAKLSRQIPETEARHGAIAAVVTGRVCEHVGIIIAIAGILYVMETDEKTGPRIVPLNEFIEDRVNVRYYAPA